MMLNEQTYLRTVRTEYSIENFSSYIFSIERATSIVSNNHVFFDRRLLNGELQNRFGMLSHPAIDRVVEQAGGEPEWGNIIKQRIEIIKNSLNNRLPENYSTAKKFVNRVKSIRDRIVYKKQTIRKIQKSVTDRVLDDFVANTTYSSFEEYSREVQAIPEYRKTIEEFWGTFTIHWYTSSSRIFSVLLSGVKPMQVTGFWSQNSSEYSQTRDEVESENFGISVDKLRKEVPPTYRSTSMLISKKVGFYPLLNNIYGDSAIEFERSKLFDAIERGEIYLTLTLGDSIRASKNWHGRAIPFELFPSFAAPFIHQERGGGEGGDIGVVDYVEGVHGITDVFPDFLNNIHKRMKIGVRTNAVMADTLGGPSNDYIEVQTYGPISTALIKKVTHQRSFEFPAPIYRGLQALGSKLKRDLGLVFRLSWRNQFKGLLAPLFCAHVEKGVPPIREKIPHSQFNSIVGKDRWQSGCLY